MRKVFLFAVVFGIGDGVCVFADGNGFQYQVGQVWTYEHEGGMQPWEQDAISTYTLTVLRREKVGDKDCWVIEEHYERRGNIKVGRFVAPDHSLIQRILVRGGKAYESVTYEPPLEDPFFSLKVREEKESEHVLVTRRLIDGKERERVWITRTIKRLPNESVSVPAGTFAACRKISERVVCHVDREGTRIETVTLREAWWDSHKGLVKETYANEPINFADGKVLPERKSESVLKSFTIKGAK